MSAPLFDSHCHLEDERFAGEVEATLSRMTEAGVSRCILAGSDRATSERIKAFEQELVVNSKKKTSSGMRT